MIFLLLFLVAVPLRAAAPAADWLILPAPVLAAKAGWKDVRFSVDGRGRPWLLHDRKSLLCPVEEAEFRLIAPADGLVHVGNASPLVSARGFLGVVPILEMVQEDAAGRPKIPFKPIRPMPRKGCALAKGARGALYALCRDGTAHELYVLRRGKGRRFERLLRSRERILAVAGDGDDTYASVGAGVMKVADPVQALFRHPSGPVRDLAYDPAAGLFYAVEGEVGRWTHEGLERLLPAVKAQIRVHGDELFVFSESDWGIARISGF